MAWLVFTVAAIVVCLGFWVALEVALDFWR
jgi:hypothetical protein